VVYPQVTWRRSLYDWADFHKNLVSFDTLKICAACTPFYAMTRVVDDEAHEIFYCAAQHKNRHQLPRWMYYASDVGIISIVTAISALSFVASNERLKRTARLYMLTFPTTYVIKRILKQWECDAFTRPKNEWFANRTYYGGCPSGHMMDIVYAATLFGMEFGPIAAVPLGLFAVTLAVDFINHNRHFPSQIVAGSCLGFIFGLAAHKSLSYEASAFSLDLVSNEQLLGVRAEYRF